MAKRWELEAGDRAGGNQFHSESESSVEEGCHVYRSHVCARAPLANHESRSCPARQQSSHDRPQHSGLVVIKNSARMTTQRDQRV